MKGITTLALWTILLFVSSCTKNEEGNLHEGIKQEWIEKDWVLDGWVKDCHINYSEHSHGEVYYDKKQDKLLNTPILVLSYTRSSDTLKPGQLTYGRECYALYEITGNVLKVKIVEHFRIVGEAEVRISPVSGSDDYILNVLYEGENYELVGYMK